MRMIDFSKHQIGKRFKVVDQWVNPRGSQNWDGKMDRWLGSDLTVKNVGYSLSGRPYFSAEECGDWCWFEELIDYLIDDNMQSELEDDYSKDINPSDVFALL